MMTCTKCGRVAEVHLKGYIIYYRCICGQEASSKFIELMNSTYNPGPLFEEKEWE